MNEQIQKQQNEVAPFNKGNRFVFNGLTSNPIFNMESNVGLPKIQEGEVLVRVKSATICLSDIHTITGARIEPTPSVLGHEACVEIVEHKRDKAKFDLNIGDRATFSIADVCGECEFCLNDLSQKCVKLFKYGHSLMSNGTGFNGCYATHIVLRKGTTIIKLPDEIDDNLASTINCALATMVNAVDSLPSKVKKSKGKALIQGDGLLGLYGIALLKDLGFKEVYCLGHQESRRQLIKDFGAIPLILTSLPDGHQNTFDCILEVCGMSDVIQDGVRLLKAGGAYAFVGMVHPNSSLAMLTGEQIIRKCLTIQGIHNYDAKHLKMSVEFLNRTLKSFPYQQLVFNQTFRLDELPEAIELAKQKKYPRICVRP